MSYCFHKLFCLILQWWKIQLLNYLAQKMHTEKKNLHKNNRVCRYCMDSRKLDACENWWLWGILQIGCRDRITNIEVRERTQEKLLSNGVRERRLKWLGHMLRMKEERITRRVYQWQPSGKRSRGRPSNRWMDCIEEDLRGAKCRQVNKTRI